MGWSEGGVGRGRVVWGKGGGKEDGGLDGWWRRTAIEGGGGEVKTFFLSMDQPCCNYLLIHVLFHNVPQLGSGVGGGGGVG